MDHSLSDNSGQQREYLTFKGVRTHNLKNISSQFPLKKWIAVTGVSGSGKSSLVFDTIYSEAQRRFLETLGTYERQFLQGLPEGEFDEIENVPAAVALKQSNKTGDPRSVIATVADIAEPLRSLFVSLMDQSCTKCGSAVHLHKADDLIQFLLASKNKEHDYLLTVPFSITSAQLAQDLAIQGYSRVALNGEIFDLEDLSYFKKGYTFPQQVELILDRINCSSAAEEIKNRAETLWSQIKFAPLFSFLKVIRIENKKMILNEEKIFYVQPYCDNCNMTTHVIQLNDLNWQSILGYCPTCAGLGNLPVLDENKIIPNPQLSLAEGAIKPWSTKTFEWMNDELLRACKKRNINIKQSYSSLSPEIQKWIWSGEEKQARVDAMDALVHEEAERRFDDVSGKLRPRPQKKKGSEFISLTAFFDLLEEERYKSSSRILLAKYRKYILCPSCQGARIGEAGRNAVCCGKHYHEIFQSEIVEVLEWLEKLKKEKIYEKKLNAIPEIYAENHKKISLLVRLGLGSTHLFRRSKTLSGGEYQRVLLTRVIGNGLTDTLYVLDEPSVGLGQNEIPTLVSCIQELRDLGNTILMVEHDKTLISAADEILELGPGGGKEGGELLEVKNKTPRSFKNNLVSVNKQKEKMTKERMFNKENSLFIQNFSALNCKNLNVEFLLGKLNVIMGPSGAGKSTLLHYGLQAALEKYEDTQITHQDVLDLDAQIGTWRNFSFPEDFFQTHSLVFVEQKASHRSISSIPATILGLMDLLRKNFAATSEAKQLGLDASDFSFNGAGGCESCGGRGHIEDDLFFLGKVDKICPDCEGTRYRNETLKVKWLHKNIHEWLSTSIQECLKTLAKSGSFQRALHLATELGLGHLPLGMPSSALSGGEAQRLRICSALTKSSKKIFCILDEPTRGLSETDIGNMLATMLRLCVEGHTFVTVEHHELFRINAHHLINIGPGSGIHGGKITERFLCSNQS